MCGAEQELKTEPKPMYTNYVRFTGMIYQLDPDLSIQALCPECAPIVGEFIKKEKRSRFNDVEKKEENRVSTNR